MKNAFFEFTYLGEEYNAKVTLSDITIPFIYMVSYINKNNSNDKGAINLHDYKKGNGIETGINNHDQILRDVIKSELQKGSVFIDD